MFSMLKLFNTLTRKIELFKPLHDAEVGIYTCGPTVYDYIHIGNCRAFVFADLLHRYLEYKGYKVKHVVNLTDVDDKTIKGSQKEGIPLSKYTEKYAKAFFEDIATLNIKPAFKYPRATEHIKEMVELIKKLLEKGYAYKAKDGIYYDISKFPDYGKLSKIDVSKLKKGARVNVQEYDKQEAADFALWKFWTPEDGDVFWETEIGKGRPGWHIECSAMSMKYLGETFDIHTGGVDLIFPHHENEIAQSEAATGKKFVNYWLHNEFVLVNGKKMSKSLGNFFTLRDLLNKGYSWRAIRYTLLSVHYREQLNISEESLEAARNAVERIYDFLLRLKESNSEKPNENVEVLIKNLLENFEKEMDNDLNISAALAVIFNFIKEINKLELTKEEASEVKKAILKLDNVLGLKLEELIQEKLPKEIEELIKKREELRKNKQYQEADKIRDELKKKGILLEDTKEGTIWKFAI